MSMPNCFLLVNVFGLVVLTIKAAQEHLKERDCLKVLPGISYAPRVCPPHSPNTTAFGVFPGYRLNVA